MRHHLRLLIEGAVLAAFFGALLTIALYVV
jgi:hypothetical protein